MLALGVAALLVVAVTRAAPAAAAASTGGYQPPVSAPVADPFRPPSTPYGPGNRGIDYATAPGTDVRAAADGEVVFAGQVGGTLHVVVLHGDGIRTSYSFLSSIRVQRGDAVRQGQVLGTTGAQPFHFGARAGDAYVDPALLFSTGPPRVHLVPDSERLPLSEARERSGLLGSLVGLGSKMVGAAGDVAGVGADAVDWAAGETADAGGRVTGAAVDAVGGQAMAGLDSLRTMAADCVQTFQLAEAAVSGFDQGDCTPSAVDPPNVDGHILVLVGGLGSEGNPSEPTKGAAIFAVDTGALGDDSVYRFSYRGGTIDENPYGKSDTEQDIRLSGARLRQLLERIQHEHPGVTVDILAHSQGGLVTRAALAPGYDRTSPLLPQLGAIVTVGSPHQGTDGATAAAMLRRNPVADFDLRAVHVIAPNQDDPRAASISEMSETSGLVGYLNDHPLPNDVWVTSVGGREDILVPAAQTHLQRAHNITLSDPHGLTTHDALPKSKQALREMKLALNHMPPTCQSLLTRAANALMPFG
ncbi:MAG: peptidoglycan DD-metalloendopeptidase family protein, partial [Acidimicrobiia bacterium]|nr:peptidoglycan DD-metalloendopeptidase family protein [Acidimicrobiia bacterium]